MPRKMARSAPLPPFGVPRVTAVVPADCQNAGKSQECSQNRAVIQGILVKTSLGICSSIPSWRCTLALKGGNVAMIGNSVQCADVVDDHLRAEAALRDSERQLETKVAERTAELRRSEAYLAEAQRLSHTGSFGWKSDSGEIVWSDETYRIFEYDPAVKPTMRFSGAARTSLRQGPRTTGHGSRIPDWH